MSDILAVAFGMALGILASIPIALVVAVSVRQQHDTCDFSGWCAPDEISEDAAVTLYFAQAKELEQWPT